MNLRSFIVLFFSTVLSFVSCQKDFVDTRGELNEQSSLPRSLTSSAVPVHRLFEVDSIGKKVQYFNETRRSSWQRDRMNLLMIPSQMLPTGFVALPNSTVTLHVELLEGDAAPVLMVGTYDRESTAPLQVNLSAGSNTIQTATGGLLWIVYVSPGETIPSSRARITFEDGYYSAPVFIKNKTTSAEWSQQLSGYTSNRDVLMVGQRVYMVYDRDLHPNVASQDNNMILDHADFAFTTEQNFSGLDGSSPLHEPLEVPHLMVHSLRSGYMYATSFRTGYVGDGARTRVFTENIVSQWGLWHELGHMHQQTPYLFNGLTEVTVNLYSLAVERALGLPSRIARDNHWPAALAYINNTDPNKSFHNLNGFWTELCMFHQLWLAYGDEFYITLHKQTREETQVYSTDDQRVRNFMLKATQISGHDLTTFFRTWALRDALNVYAEIAALNLPAPTIEPHTLTD